MIEAKNAKLISKYSSLSHEDEAILGLGTCLRVKSDVLGHGSLNLVHLVEVKDEDEDEDEELDSSFQQMKVNQSLGTTAGKEMVVGEVDDLFSAYM